MKEGESDKKGQRKGVTENGEDKEKEREGKKTKEERSDRKE